MKQTGLKHLNEKFYYPVASEIRKKEMRGERKRERWRELENELSSILRLSTFCLIHKVLGHPI